MKKILILGIGMAGHVIYKYLDSLKKYDLTGISKTKTDYVDYQIDIRMELYELAFVLENIFPDVIINCTGILVKESENFPSRAIYMNTFFPRWLEHKYKDTSVKIIHISTDCVFDGVQGYYSETTPPNESNWYGRTKAMGELNNNKDLTLRTSIIGPELKDEGSGLFSWFLRQTGIVRGYDKVLWNGITTLELAKQIDKILDIDNLVGLYHLITRKEITKYDLLILIQKIWGKKDIEIIKDSLVYSNKVLMNGRLEYEPYIPNYDKQLQELHDWYK